MGGMGPAPKDPSQRARRNAPTIGTTVLPPQGREGATPRWPLPPDPSLAAELKIARAKAKTARDAWMEATPAAAKKLARELDRLEKFIETTQLIIRQRKALETALWKYLWSTPQAVMWERQFLFRSVALYVQSQILGELGKLDRAKEARLWATELGLTPKGMQNLRWSIAADELGERRDADAADAAAAATPTSARGRRGPLKAVGDE